MKNAAPYIVGIVLLGGAVFLLYKVFTTKTTAQAIQESMSPGQHGNTYVGNGGQVLTMSLREDQVNAVRAMPVVGSGAVSRVTEDLLRNSGVAV